MAGGLPTCCVRVVTALPPLHAGSRSPEAWASLCRRHDGAWQQGSGGQHEGEDDEETLWQVTDWVVHQENYR